jgi:hypothetical protein
MKNVGFAIALILAGSSLTSVSIAENSAQQDKMTTCKKSATGMIF